MLVVPTSIVVPVLLSLDAVNLGVSRVASVANEQVAATVFQQHPTDRNPKLSEAGSNEI
jgi:hypothetical protein